MYSSIIDLTPHTMRVWNWILWSGAQDANVLKRRHIKFSSKTEYLYSKCVCIDYLPNTLRIGKATEIHSKLEKEGGRNWTELTAGYTRVEINED